MKQMTTNQKFGAVIVFCCAVAISVLLSCCATLKNTKFDCISKKVVHITLIDAKGNPYTFHQTYCDSIRVVVLPDTTNIKQ